MKGHRDAPSEPNFDDMSASACLNIILSLSVNTAGLPFSMFPYSITS